MWNVLGYFLALWLLQPCPSTKGSCYSGGSDLLRMFLAVIQYAKCRRAGPARPPPLPPNAHSVKGHSCFFALPFFCPPLYPSGSASFKWCPQGRAFPLSSILCWSCLSSSEFNHTWESLFTSCIYWKHCKSVHHSQWAVDFAGLWRQRQSCEGELCEEVPTSAFRHRISIIISPGAVSTLGDNFCLPVLPCSLNLCKMYPLYQCGSFLGAVSALLSLYSTAPQAPICLSQPHRESSSNHDAVFLLETRSQWGHKWLPRVPAGVWSTGWDPWVLGFGCLPLPQLPSSLCLGEPLRMIWGDQGG